MPQSGVVKTCTKCKLELPLSMYSKHKTGGLGVKAKCKKCTKEEYKPKSKEKAIEHSKRWRDKNKQKQSETWQAYYAAHKERIKYNARQRGASEEAKAKKREYALVNRDRINAKKRIRRKNMTITQALEKKCRDRFYKVIVRMKKGVKHCSPIKLIGCSLDELKLHIECQFLDGMTWSNHGNGDGKWNIDHEIPLHTFDLFKLDEQQKAFHYTNLRPICSTDNFKRPENKKSFYERAKTIIN